MKIEIPEGSLPKAQDGESIEITVKGTVSVSEDGARTLSVNEIDGNPVMGEVSPEADTAEVEAKLGTALRERQGMMDGRGMMDREGMMGRKGMMETEE